MLIILEGPDGACKTTLADHVEAYLREKQPLANVVRMHRGPITQHPLNEYVLPLIDYRAGSNTHIICDRWHVGEWVYPSILKRATVADRAVWYYIEMFLRSRGATSFYLTAPLHHLEQNVITRGDDLIQAGDLRKIVDAYRMMKSDAITRTHSLEVFGRRDIDHIVRFVTDQASVTESLAMKTRKFTTYVGEPQPLSILLGDVRHTISDMKEDLRPAFMPYRATSGHYLLSHLPASFIRDLGVVNVNDVDEFESVVTTFPSARYVALGARAYERANRYIQVPGVPHPQYIRRFHNRHADAYVHVIRETLATREDHLQWRP